MIQADDMEKDADGDELNPEEPVMSQQLCSMNGEPETEDKENNNGTEETQAVRYEDHSTVELKSI